MAWTNIPDANLDAGSPLRDVDLMALRDNIAYARNTHGFAVFTSNGVFVPVAGITTYRVTLYGGGGGGGGLRTGYGDGGRGGFGGTGMFYANGITVNQQIVIGGGGYGGSANSLGGGGGNTTAFGITAAGGGGGGVAYYDNGAYQAGPSGNDGGCNSAGVNAHAGIFAYPFFSSYGWCGGQSIAGNGGICIIEW